MVLSNRKRKLLAVLLTAGLMCSLPGMSALAGSTGVGAAKTAAEQGGPGVVKGPEQAPSQDQTGGEGAAQTPEQSGDGGQAQAGDAGQAQTDGGAQPQTPEQPPAGDSGQPLQINYSVFFHPQGWTDTKPDNTALQAPGGSWVTALKANLINIPAGAQVGVRYQVNLSGSGWLDWAEDGAETGGAGGEMPLEAVRFGLYGDSASGYDIYYRVLQNGSWTDWAANEATAGQEGAGLRVDGIRVGIVAKGAEPPADAAAPASGIDPSRPMIALTFDDGPRTSVTSRILDSLQANGGRATFFMVGSRVDSNADVIRRMAAQGCEVANHTYDHKYITKIGADGIRSQVGSTNQKIQAVCGVAPTLLRPPGGYKDARVFGGVGFHGDARGDVVHRYPGLAAQELAEDHRDGPEPGEGRRYHSDARYLRSHRGCRGDPDPRTDGQGISAGDGERAGLLPGRNAAGAQLQPVQAIESCVNVNEIVRA